MIADLQGPIAFVPFSVYLACLAFSIWAVVDANSKPAEAYPPGSLSKSTLTTCIAVFTFLGLVGGFAFAIYYVGWVRPKAIAFVGAHPNVTNEPFETSRQFDRTGSKRDFTPTSVSLFTALAYGVGAYLLIGFIGLPTVIHIFVPAFTTVMMFCVVSEYLQPTSSAFRGSSPPVTHRQIWTNQTTSKGNGRVFTLWYLGVTLVLYAFYWSIADWIHWSPYATTNHIWLNAVLQMSIFIVGLSVANCKSARLKRDALRTPIETR
jgi:hypothetical protein